MIAYHCTNCVGADGILAEGFRPGTWFAKHLEDAVEFGGGEHIFEVAIVDLSEPTYWQFRLTETVPTHAISRHYIFRRRILAGNEHSPKASIFTPCVHGEAYQG